VEYILFEGGFFYGRTMGYKPLIHGKVLKFPILGGLGNHCTALGVVTGIYFGIINLLKL